MELDTMEISYEEKNNIGWGICGAVVAATICITISNVYSGCSNRNYKAELEHYPKQHYEVFEKLVSNGDTITVKKSYDARIVPDSVLQSLAP